MRQQNRTANPTLHKLSVNAPL